jgi:hypothetical protein
MAKKYHKKQLKKMPANRNHKTTMVIKVDQHVYNPTMLVIRKGSTLNAPDLAAEG